MFHMLEMDALKKLLSSEFDMKEFGEAKKILGAKIMRETSKGVFYLWSKEIH